MPADDRGPRKPGTTVWVDLSTTDVEGATRFYEQLLGWEQDEAETAMGTYVLARVAGSDLGGIIEEDADETAAGMPPAWTVIVRSDDLDARLAHAQDLSGTVLQAPMSIPDGARVAVLAGGRRAVGRRPHDLRVRPVPAGPRRLALVRRRRHRRPLTCMFAADGAVLYGPMPDTWSHGRLARLTASRPGLPVLIADPALSATHARGACPSTTPRPEGPRRR